MGDPDCPEEAKLAKQIKHLIGNKPAVVGDAEQEFNLEEAEFGGSGANPNAEPSPEVAEAAVAEAAVEDSSTQ